MPIEGVRIFGKEEGLEKYKCKDCLYQDDSPLKEPYGYACSVCKDRPTRKNDKSEFIQDFTDEERKRISKEHKDEEEGIGKYNY